MCSDSVLQICICIRQKRVLLLTVYIILFMLKTHIFRMKPQLESTLTENLLINYFPFYSFSSILGKSIMLLIWKTKSDLS